MMVNGQTYGRTNVYVKLACRLILLEKEMTCSSCSSNCSSNRCSCCFCCSSCPCCCCCCSSCSLLSSCCCCCSFRVSRWARANSYIANKYLSLNLSHLLYQPAINNYRVFLKYLSKSLKIYTYFLPSPP